jgi:hypothetical protein
MGYHRRMRMGRSVAIAVLASCGGSGKAPPPVKPIAIDPPKEAAKPPEEKPACIKQPEDVAAIRNASGDDTKVSYCVGTAVDQCFELELASGKLTHLETEPAGQSPALDSQARIETTNPEFKVCTEATGCKTLTPQVWPGAAPLRAATNGTIAAVMLGDAEAGKGYIEIIDVLKTKRLATVKYARGEFRCGDVAILSDSIYVNATVCQGTSGRAALYSPKGKKIANVGGRPDFGTFGNAHTQIDGPLWAFLNENGNRIVLQDVTKGKVTKTIDVSPLYVEASGAKMGNPGEAAIVRLGDNKVAVIGGTPANGSVAVVDLQTGAKQVVKAPICN